LTTSPITTCSAWSGDVLVGREELLRPLVEAAITVENRRLRIGAGERAWVRLRNDSDVRFELQGGRPEGGITAPASVVVAARGTSLLELRVRREATPGTARLDLATRWPT
jgi:hypothetical protein